MPAALLTAEFCAEVRRVLRPGGLHLLNLIDGPGLGTARAVAATLLDAFAHVAVVAERDVLMGRERDNLVFAASQAALPLHLLRAAPRRRARACASCAATRSAASRPAPSPCATGEGRRVGVTHRVGEDDDVVAVAAAAGVELAPQVISASRAGAPAVSNSVQKPSGMLMRPARGRGAAPRPRRPAAAFAR